MNIIQNNKNKQNTNCKIADNYYDFVRWTPRQCREQCSDTMTIIIYLDKDKI